MGKALHGGGADKDHAVEIFRRGLDKKTLRHLTGSSEATLLSGKKAFGIFAVNRVEGRIAPFGALDH